MKPEKFSKIHGYNWAFKSLKVFFVFLHVESARFFIKFLELRGIWRGWSSEQDWFVLSANVLFRISFCRWARLICLKRQCMIHNFVLSTSVHIDYVLHQRFPTLRPICSGLQHSLKFNFPTDTLWQCWFIWFFISQPTKRSWIFYERQHACRPHPTPPHPLKPASPRQNKTK
jgi:hypothetical protein